MQSISIVEFDFWRTGAFPHLLLDVRRKQKRNEEADEIPGGLWFDPALWLDWKDTIPQNRPVVVYCAHGHELSQGLAATLRAMGLDARSLDGGIEAWRIAGQPVLTIAETVS